jgi:hypothetical protein
MASRYRKANFKSARPPDLNEIPALQQTAPGYPAAKKKRRALKAPGRAGAGWTERLT